MAETARDAAEAALALVDHDGEALLLRGFVAAREADGWLAALLEDLPWRQDRVRLFGREHRIPRRQVWVGDPGARYRYSGLDLDPQPWTSVLPEIRERVEGAAAAAFDAVLCNLYRDGRDSVGWHADDEATLGARPTLASLSLGATRAFALRHRDRGAHRRVDLCHGDLLLMRGELQHRWQHALPKTRRPVGPRVNLTFRRILPDRI